MHLGPKKEKENKMKLQPTMAFILLWALDEAATNQNGNLTDFKELFQEGEHPVDLHSRRKRYIVFPKGSSLQLLLELLVHVPTQFRVVVGPTLQVAWPLPSETSRSSRSTSNIVQRRVLLELTNGPLEGKKYKIFSDLATFLDLFGMTVGLAWQLPDDPMIYSEFKKKHKIYKRNVFKKMEGFLRPGGADGRQCVLKALCESGQRTPSKKEFLIEILHKIFSVDEDEEELEENREDRLYKKAHRSVNQNCDSLYPKCQFSVFRAIQ